MNHTLINKIKELFRSSFRKSPLLVRAPGRINLIGEHTDYNSGFVLPASIDKATYFAIEKSGSMQSKIISIDMNETYEFSIDKLEKSDKGWPNYIIGVILELKKEGINFPEGINCVFGGDIPIGAGMSSSASVESGIAMALNHLYKIRLNRKYLATIAQRAENNFVGVNSGIMDQFASLLGAEGKVLRIDCRSLEYEYFPFNYPQISIVLCNTGVQHNLASSEYNTRRKQCEEGVEKIQNNHPDVKSLRDATFEQLEEIKEKVSDDVYKRCYYVISEIERMDKAVAALKKNDLNTFGTYMYETHEGLSKIYEVSCKELDLLVDYTLDLDHVLGARMMGGGFGGCTINLVKNDSLEEFKETMSLRYKEDTGIDLKIYVNKITSGVELLNI